MCGVVLFLEGSSTHLTAECIKVAREHGVSVVVFSSHQTDHIQPLDVAIFKALKAYERKFQTNFMRECRQTRRGGTVTPALFVKFATAAWNEATSPVAICNGFRRCGLFPFSLEEFLGNIPQGRIQHDTPPPPPLEVEDEVVSLDTNDSPVKTFKDFGCQVTGKAINNETKNDPLNLRLGATVTSEDFFTAALELEKKQKEKEAKRKRKGGQGKKWAKRRRVEREEEEEEEEVDMDEESEEDEEGYEVMSDREDGEEEEEERKEEEEEEEEEEYVEDDDGPMVCAMGDEETGLCQHTDWSVKQDWVGCDHCTAWYHLRCSGLKEMPKEDEEWMCPQCEKDMEEER